MHRYSALGLNIDSELDCPELPPHASHPDLRIVRGRVPPRIPGAPVEGPCYQVSQEQVRLQIDGIGAFLIARGREIVVAAEPNADDDSVRLFLLTLALGVALQQRGALVLRASAVAFGGRGVVLAGRPGAGKSTLAAMLEESGHRVMTDDPCCISFPAGGERPRVQPGVATLRLWSDSLHALNRDSDGLRRVRPAFAKYAKPFRASHVSESVPVALVCLVDDDAAESECVPLERSEKLFALMTHTYLPQYLEGMGLERAHFGRCSALANAIPMVRLRGRRREEPSAMLTDLLREPPS